jgi:hypothetical protein
MCRSLEVALKDVASMNQQCVHSTNGHQLMSLYTASGVEQEHHEAFDLQVKIRIRRLHDYTNRATVGVYDVI